MSPIGWSQMVACSLRISPATMPRANPAAVRCHSGMATNLANIQAAFGEEPLKMLAAALRRNAMATQEF